MAANLRNLGRPFRDRYHLSAGETERASRGRDLRNDLADGASLFDVVNSQHDLAVG